MASPYRKRTQGPKLDINAGREISSPATLSSPSSLAGSGVQVFGPLLGLSGERDQGGQGWGSDTGAPCPIQPLLVTWLKQVQSSKYACLKTGITTGPGLLPTLRGSSDDRDLVN